MKYPRFEIREMEIPVTGIGAARRTQYRLWLVLEAGHERHIDSSWDEIEMYNLADRIKKAAIEPAIQPTQEATK